MFNNILYVIFDRYPYFKGSTTHVKYFTDALRDGGYNVKIFALSFINSNGVFGVKLREKNLFKRAFKFADIVFDYFLRENVYNILHFRDPFVGYEFLNFKNEMGLSCVYEVNGFPSIEWKERYPNISGEGIKILEKMEEFSILNSDVVITPSKITFSYIRNEFGDVKNLFLIPNGVDTSLFYPRKIMEENCVLFCGAVRPWQGLFEFVEVAGKSLSRRGLFLKVVGDIKKRDRERLLELCKKRNLNCEVEGVVPHEFIPEIINRAKICLLPLNSERRNVVQGACPIKLFEYMACKKPVLASDVKIVREHFGDEELFLFKDFNLDEIERLLDLILFDEGERERRVESGYKKIVEKYLWKNAGEKLIEIYKRFFPI